MRGASPALMAGALAFAAPAVAQTFPIDPDTPQSEVQSQNEGLGDAARTADAGAGEIGQRQSRDDTAPNVEPLGRIDNRIENRVQNRLRNRIDRNYDATANATSPFKRAEDQTRQGTRRRPRR